MIRWDPGRDLMSLKQAIDKLFEDSAIRPSSFTFQIGEGNIPVDILQTDTTITVKATIPGVKPEEVDISISGETLTIKAEKKEEQEFKEKEYVRKENRYGLISRSITLPVEVDADRAEAMFDNGILTFTIPKSEKSKPKQIKVQPKRQSTESL
jgi:HSP20 family protein